MIAKPIPLYLISGFLGSGKTSFLSNILAAFGDSVKIGIVQNEFSSVNIDSRIIDQSGKPHVKLEVNNGSVFCLCLLNNFIPALSRFIDNEKPDMVFIEASGLSDPSAILQVLNSAMLSKKVRFARAYTIVDGAMFLKQKAVLKILYNQVRISDCLLINKCDKLEKEQVEQTEIFIREINPFCKIFRTEYSNIDQQEMDLIAGSSLKAATVENIDKEESKPMKAPSPEIRVETYISAKKIYRGDFARFELALRPFLRVKGFLRASDDTNWTVQGVSGEITFRRYENDLSRSEIAIFGEQIDIKKISNFFCHERTF